MSTAGSAIRAARRSRGLSQRRLARLAGTSSAALSLYERGLKQPRLETLARLLDAAGHRLELRAVPLTGRDRIQRRSRALHEAIAERIREDPVPVLAHARRNLSTMRRANPDGSADEWLDAWSVLLRGPRDVLCERMVADDDGAADLRQNTPFAGVLTPQERWAIYRRYAA